MPPRQTALTNWSGSLHQTFRVLPIAQYGNENLMAFLDSADGEPWEDVHARFSYDRERARRPSADEGSDPKRYRDLRQVFENSGLFWEDDDGHVHLTDLGRILKEFMPYANAQNVSLVAQHAALGLNICQLRNPTGSGQRFAAEMEVFPFRFIWKAMLKLENRIDSDELNRAIFATQNEDQLKDAIDRIQAYRDGGDIEDLGPETQTGKGKNDRLIPIVCLASFGWTLINQKEAGYYIIKPDCVQFLRSAVNVPVEHRDYSSVEEYVKRIARAACIPKDVR